MFMHAVKSYVKMTSDFWRYNTMK